MKIKNIGKKVKWFVSIELTMLILWSIAYYLSSFVYTTLHDNADSFIRYLISSQIALLLWFITITLIHSFLASKRRAVFNPIIEVLREIAKGNFKVTINPDKLPQFGHLVQSINQMASQLDEMEKMRQEFISNVSHEIQSPLTSISGFAIALQTQDLRDEERQHYLQIIETESKRLSKLSENLLKLTSLESDHHPFEPATYRLDQQLKSVILASEPQWSAKNLDIKVSLKPLSIDGDADLLNQVWFNLISNSVKFSQNGGVLDISLQDEKNSVVVQIADSGIGISTEDQIHIFERFYKADRSRNREEGGNGLGLAIVKRIIEMHQGSIEVASELGNGTVFTIRLPKNRDTLKK